MLSTTQPSRRPTGSGFPWPAVLGLCSREISHPDASSALSCRSPPSSDFLNYNSVESLKGKRMRDKEQSGLSSLLSVIPMFTSLPETPWGIWPKTSENSHLYSSWCQKTGSLSASLGSWASYGPIIWEANGFLGQNGKRWRKGGDNMAGQLIGTGLSNWLQMGLGFGDKGSELAWGIPPKSYTLPVSVQVPSFPSVLSKMSSTDHIPLSLLRLL